MHASIRPLAWALLNFTIVVGSHAEPQVVLSTDRDAYRFAEPVWLYVRIDNHGSDPIVVEDPRCSRTQTRIEIRTENGRTFPMTGPASCATTVRETILPERDRLHAFELLEYYGVDGADEYPFGILPPGRYEVRYRSGETLSPPVSFAVDSLDAESSEAFHAYIRTIAPVRPETLREAPSRFRSYVERYPESSFAPALLCRAGVLSDLFFDSGEAFDDFIRLLELYPNSGYTSVAVRHLAFGMGRNQQARSAYLATIPTDLPGTLAADFARRELTAAP